MASGNAAASRLVERVARICVRAQDPLDLLAEVAAAVRAQIPYAAAGWLLTDPDTLLMTGVYAENVSRTQHLQLIECELTEDDVNKFFDLAERGVAAASLSAATDGDLSRSIRWRRIYEPNGYGDEIRGVFRSGGATWGHVCLTRAGCEPWFSTAEVDVVARLCPHIGNGIRACLLLAPPTGRGDTAAPALVVLADDGSVDAVTPQATELLGALDDERLQRTIVLHQVAQRARALADGGHGPAAMARVQGASGNWLVVRGARLASDGDRPGRTALVMEPASRSDIAPLLLQLHELTPREQEITALLLTGMPTAEIARRVWITTETLRGHVKSIFAKLAVNSRPELAALLSKEPQVHPP
ncbi:helix-turn-helix transcriptional regulator [Mycolicibacterium pulveris]|uniref:helix-turn-helix transcriptional regulator n=1 Tax=Mycolicibacterium pulveris TaxID=36813 RepID=UPI003CEB9925